MAAVAAATTASTIQRNSTDPKRASTRAWIADARGIVASTTAVQAATAAQAFRSALLRGVPLLMERRSHATAEMSPASRVGDSLTPARVVA
jgi:hypothetical protein